MFRFVPFDQSRAKPRKLFAFGCAETTSLTHLARGFPSQMIRLDCEGEVNRGYVRMVAGPRNQAILLNHMGQHC
jgi:hypothetical protein